MILVVIVLLLLCCMWLIDANKVDMSVTKKVKLIPKSESCRINMLFDIRLLGLCSGEFILSFLPKFLPVVGNCAAAVASSTTVDCGRQLTGWLARNLPSSISSLIEIDRLYTAETSRPRCQTHDASHGRARTWQEMGKAE